MATSAMVLLTQDSKIRSSKACVKPLLRVNQPTCWVVVAEVSPFRLRHEIHNRGDQRISRGVAGNAAIDTETLAAEVLGECPS